MRKQKGYFIILLVSFMLIGNITFSYGDKAIIIAKEGLIREEPSFESVLIDKIPLGEELEIIEEKDNWFLIEYLNEIKKVNGWIYRDLIIQDGKKETVKIGVVTTETLNVRTGPDIKYSAFTSLKRGNDVTILEEQEEWYLVLLKNGVKGWVHRSYIDVSMVSSYPRGQVITKTEVKEDKNEESKLISSLNQGTEFYIKGYDTGWFNIDAGGIEGWVMAEHVELNIDIFNPVNRSGNRAHTLSNIKEVASKYIGRPYSYGSTGPASFDCSGFVTYIFNQYYADYLKDKKVQLPRSSRDMAKVGVNILKGNLQPGDLVFFNRGGNTAINHVGIYIGEDNFIHAAYSNRRGIVISSLKENIYMRTYVKGVRI